MKINLIFIIWLLSYTPTPNHQEIIGDWQMVSFEAFTNILLSPRHYEASEADRNRLEETFQLVLDNTYYNFKDDTVYFSDYKEYKIIEKTGIWNIESDTLYINDISKIMTYKYFIKKVNSDSLVMSFIYRNGKVGRNDMVFVRK